MNNCDANILVERSLVTFENSSMPLWSNMEKDQEATIFWYYQKFHQETNRGQILAIRENWNLKKDTASASISDYISNATDPSLCSSLGQISLLSSINKKLAWAMVMMGAILVKMIF